MIRAAILCSLFSTVTQAQLHHRLSLWVAGDAWLTPELGGHGIALARYELTGLPRNARFVIDYNTDTLRVGLDGLRFGRLELGFVAGGEVFIAGLLGDYYRDGRSDGARGFRASWAQAGGFAKIDLHPSFFELAISARRWFFERQGGTSPDLILPPEAWVGEWRLRYTLWALAPDRSQWEAQRPFMRAVGVAFGVELGADVRSEARPWGARADSFSPRDLRNDPSTIVWSVRQWLRAGAPLGSRVRLQLSEVALWMSGADDLDRARVGGFNPYVIPIAGAPWPAWLADRLLAAELSLHVRLWRELEAGALLDGAVLGDIERTGNPLVPGPVWGAGLFADLRIGAWQIDVRGGYCPTLRGVSLFASLGWAFAR